MIDTGSMVLICQCIFAISLLSFLEKGMAFHLNKLESSSPRNAFCQVWLKLAQWFWRRFFKISSMHFCYFIIISPWKSVLLLHYINIVYQGWNVNFNACLILYLLFLSVCCISGSQICKILNIKMMHLGKNVDYQIKFPWQYITVYRKNHYPHKRLWDRRTDRWTTDNRWSEKLTWAFSSGKLKSVYLYTMSC